VFVLNSFLISSENTQIQANRIALFFIRLEIKEKLTNNISLIYTELNLSELETARQLSAFNFSPEIRYFE